MKYQQALVIDHIYLSQVGDSSGLVWSHSCVCGCLWVGRSILAGLPCLQHAWPHLLYPICHCPLGLVWTCPHSSGKVMRESGSTHAFLGLDSKSNITSSTFYWPRQVTGTAKTWLGCEERDKVWKKVSCGKDFEVTVQRAWSNKDIFGTVLWHYVLR